MFKKSLLSIGITFSALVFSGLLWASEGHQGNAKQANSETGKTTAKCQQDTLLCAKTVTSAFAPNGDLWRVWVYKQTMYYQISKDLGHQFGPVQEVGIAPEKISARNENRPKIGFDGKPGQERGVYLSWASPLEKRFTSNIRFTYSSDYGNQFSEPVTVNDDGLVTGHSFNEMRVEDDGEVTLVWLDSRLRFQAKQQGRELNGSALFHGSANPRQLSLQKLHQKPLQNKTFSFSNEMLANNTCVCCRIAMDTNQNGNLAVLWRHIFGDNIREFALMTLNEDSDLTRVSHDLWKIDGCPHQGGGISIDENNRYHLVWFNQGSVGQGIFYAHSDDQGKTLTKPISIGNKTANAAHPYVMINKVQSHKEEHKIVDVVWTEFNGSEFQLWHQRSMDNGVSFTNPNNIASSDGQSDRPFLHKYAGKTYVSWHRPQLGHWFQQL